MFDDSYEEFRDKAEQATANQKGLKFPRCNKNLRLNSEGVWSYGAKIAQLDLDEKSIQRLGYWSSTSSAHYHYVKNMLGSSYNFVEKPSPDFHIPQLVRVQNLSFDDHT